MECHFWSDIREMQQYDTLEKMCPVRSLKVNDFLKKRILYVWYQDEISLADNRMVGPFQFLTTRRNKLKYPTLSMIKSGRNWGKKGGRKESTLQISKKLFR